MRCHMIAFIAFYFILGIFLACVMRISLIIKIGSMHFDYFSGYMAGFRIPFYMIANFELICHLFSLNKNLLQKLLLIFIISKILKMKILDYIIFQKDYVSCYFCS